MYSSRRESMLAFYEAWLTKLQEIHQQLIDFTLLPTNTPDHEQQCNELIGKVMRHYRRYYSEKSNAAKEDSFFVLSAPWLTPFERTLIWVSGYKPSMVFSFIKNSVGEELTPGQIETLEIVKAETRRHEKDIEKRLAQAQERVAGQTMVNLIRTYGRSVLSHEGGAITGLDDAMEEIKAAMLETIENGDALLGSTIHKVMEVLNPIQTVKQFAAAAHYVLRIRSFGILKESQAAAAASASASTSTAPAEQ